MWGRDRGDVARAAGEAASSSNPRVTQAPQKRKEFLSGDSRILLREGRQATPDTAPLSAAAGRWSDKKEQDEGCLAPVPSKEPDAALSLSP